MKKERGIKVFNKQNSSAKRELIVVDPGKHSTKALKSGGYSTYFRTKIFDNNMDIDAHGKSYAVTYEGKNYIVGEQAEETNYDVSKTNLLHKLVTYLAISQLAESGSTIQLVLNCPVSIYKNKILRDEYKQYIFNGGEFDITVSGKSYHYTFENILVLPEDLGVIYKYVNLFKQKRVALIGLGGLNMNFQIIENLTPQISTMFTLNHGSNELETILINELNSRFGLNIDSKDAPYIIQNKGLKIRGSINKESAAIVDNVIRNFIGTVLQEAKKNGHNLDLLDVVFVGGTTLMIQDQLESIIRHVTVVNDAQWAAVEGSLKVGELKYAEANKSYSN